jgi:uncharacterized protein with PQ loop repeat
MKTPTKQIGVKTNIISFLPGNNWSSQHGTKVHSLFCAGFLIYSIVNQLHTYTFSVEFAFFPPHFSHLHVFPFLVPCCDDQLFPGKKDIMLVFTPICFVGVFIFVFIYILVTGIHVNGKNEGKKMQTPLKTCMYVIGLLLNISKNQHKITNVPN